MSVTITVSDPLAAQLTLEAQQQQVPLEQLAAQLLASGLSATKDAAWEKCNQERLALLHKSSTVALTPEESNRLGHLQTLADQRREALDAERLSEVERMERECKATLQEEA